MASTRCLLALALSTAGGCSMAPPGTDEEATRASAAQEPYLAPSSSRTLPELPSEPTWRDVLHRALLANGELEAALHEWNAAVARIDQAASWPNSNTMLSAETMFPEGDVRAIDRTTFRLGFDAMENLAFPSKARKAGEIALEDARAAGERARAAKFSTQSRVLMEWAELGYLSEAVRTSEAKIELRTVLLRTAKSRAGSGALAQEALAAEVALKIAEDELRSLEAEQDQVRARLNAAMARDPHAPLAPPAVQEARRLPASDERLFELACELNPRIAAWARETAGRERAYELARMRWIPDINPMFAWTGTVSQALGAAIMIPTSIPEIRGAIRETDARARAARAMLEQVQRDEAGELVATLVAVRDAERRAAWSAETVAPAAARAADATRRAYAAGATTLGDVLEAGQTVLDVRLAAARARADREALLARVEALVGVDLETLEEGTP